MFLLHNSRKEVRNVSSLAEIFSIFSSLTKRLVKPSIYWLKYPRFTHTTPAIQVPWILMSRNHTWRPYSHIWINFYLKISGTRIVYKISFIRMNEFAEIILSRFTFYRNGETSIFFFLFFIAKIYNWVIFLRVPQRISHPDDKCTENLALLQWISHLLCALQIFIYVQFHPKRA